jgi:hypothetical protein
MLQNVPKKLKRLERGFAYMEAKHMGQALRESADLLPPPSPPVKLPGEGVAPASAAGSSFQPSPACPPPAPPSKLPGAGEALAPAAGSSCQPSPAWPPPAPPFKLPGEGVAPAPAAGSSCQPSRRCGRWMERAGRLVDQADVVSAMGQKISELAAAAALPREQPRQPKYAPGQSVHHYWAFSRSIRPLAGEFSI